MYKYLLTTSIHHSSNKEVCMKDLSVFIQFIINIVLNYTFSYLGTLENHSPQPGMSHLKSALQSNKTSFINTRTIKTQCTYSTRCTIYTKFGDVLHEKLKLAFG